MSLKIDELKKKIIYRSLYRGSKEMDIILSSFVKENIDKFNKNELENLYDFLKLDDDILYKYKNGLEIKKKVPENKISKLFKKFNIN